MLSEQDSTQMVKISLTLGLGMLLGYFRILPPRALKFVGWIILAGIVLLLFSMGVGLGSNPEIIKNLGRIGITALTLAVSTVGGSILSILVFEHHIVHRKSEGRRRTRMSASPTGTTASHASQAGSAMTWVILGAVMAGVLAGVLQWTPKFYLTHLATIIDLALYTILLGIGLDLGGDRKAWDQLKQLGLHALGFPVFVAIGSIVGAMVSGLVLRMPLNEAGAIGAGFGWYSLSGVLLAKIYSAELGALAFLSNVLREFIAILTMPLLAKYLSPMAALSTGGATTMDTTLPIIARATAGNMTTLAIVNGFTLTLAVPILVPLIVKL